MNKYFKVSDFYDWIGQQQRGEISFSRMVELVNEKANKITPIKCCKSGENIMIGDKVKGPNQQYGFLYFDDFTNQYVIKNNSGGHYKVSSFEKVDTLQKNIDNLTTECRRKYPIKRIHHNKR